MKVIHKSHEISANYGRGVALGNFDGVHIGHQKLIQHLLLKSKSRKLESCVYTFMNHTIPVISEGSTMKYITSLDVKQQIFNHLGIDFLYLDNFSKELMGLSPKDFVEKILVKKLNCKEAIVGFDYRFGHKAEGDVNLLQELAKLYDFQVTVIDPVTIDKEKVSSSNIRKYLVDGNIEKVNSFLGRYFSLYNKVIHGDARGTKLGYPTANIDIDPLQLLPKAGVYGTLIKINNKTYMGATFIGTKPTFESYTPSVETFILDFEGNLYNQYIDIHFVERIREEVKFKTAEDLVIQINRDIKEIKKHLQPKVNMLK